jgi:hypothetical protein
MAALALPLALVLGALSDVVGALVVRFTGGPRSWWRPVGGLWDEARRLARARTRRARPTVTEAMGAAAAALGGGLAAGGAIGLVPGSAAMVYLALTLGAAGLHLAEPVRVPAGEAAASARRRDALLAEPAFVVALGALLIRWRAFDLDAIRASQTVLGPGISVGPTIAAVAVGGAAVAALAAAALRLGLGDGPVRREGQSRGAGGWLLRTVARWSVAGATAMVVAALVAGHRLDVSPSVLPFVGAAVAASGVLGLAAAALRRAPTRWRLAVAGTALVVAGGAVAVVVTM